MDSDCSDLIAARDVPPSGFGCKVLVVSAWASMGIRVSRALKKAGYKPYILSVSGERGLSYLAVAEKSVHIQVDNLEEPVEADLLIRLINKCCADWGLDFILPTEVKTSSFLYKHMSHFNTCTVPLFDDKKREFLSDKWNFYTYLKDKSVPMPETVLVSRSSQQVPFEFPVIVKPLSMENGDGIQKLASPLELTQYLGTHSVDELFIVQEFVSGDDYSVGFLSLNGEMITWATHRFSRDLGPGRHFVTGGDVLKLAEDIVRETNYTGVGVLDFRRDAATGTVYAFEINCRFGASDQYYVRAGLNLSASWVALACGSADMVDYKPPADVSIKPSMIDRLFILFSEPLLSIVKDMARKIPLFN